MNDLIKWEFALGALCVLFGFVALLTSKIYIDTKTNSPVEVAIPFLGKVKGNYPALVFVMLGSAIAVYAIKSNADIQLQEIASNRAIQEAKANTPGDDQWTITGRMVRPDGKAIDGYRGVMNLTSGSPRVDYKPGGVFEISLRLKKGEALEDYVEKIDYSSYESGSMTIYPKLEFEKRNRKENSLLEHQTDFTRQYRPVTLQVWNQPKP